MIVEDITYKVLSLVMTCGVKSVETIHSMHRLPLQPPRQRLVEADPLPRPLPVLHPDLGVVQESVEGAGGRPPAQAGPGHRQVGDQLLHGGEPRHQDLLLRPGLGTAVVTGYERVHLRYEITDMRYEI